MPYKRRYRKRKRRVRRKQPVNRNIINCTGNSLIPKTALVKLKYVSLIVLDAAAGGIASHYFRANGMFDPDQTGVGEEPLGIRVWQNFYNHYTVVGSRCKATFYANTSTAGDVSNNVVCIGLHDDPILPVTTPAGLYEQPQLVTTALGTADGNRAIANLSKNFSAKRFFGTKYINGVDQYQGNIGVSDPVEQALFGIHCGSAGTGNPTAIDVKVEIEYIAVLQEPKNLARSD